MLNEAQIRQMVVMASNPNLKRKDIRQIFGLSKASFNDILTGKSYKYIARPLCLPKARIRENLPGLSWRQLEIINGSMLGDGSIKTQKNSYFRKSQSNDNLEYLQWMFDELHPYSCSINPKFSCKPIHEGREIVGCSQERTLHQEFSSIHHRVFCSLDKKWYLLDHQGQFVLDEHGWKIKVVPTDLEITPLMLAIWYCDDGSNDQKHGRIRLCTHGFDKQYVDYLSYQLSKGFKLETNVWFDQTGHVIEIRRRNYLDFIDIVKPYIHFDCLNYKTVTKNYVAPKYFKRPYHHKRRI
jgi:hypothetical protein